MVHTRKKSKLTKEEIGFRLDELESSLRAFQYSQSNTIFNAKNDAKKIKHLIKEVKEFKKKVKK